MNFETEEEVREAFWDQSPKTVEFIRAHNRWILGATQNQLPTAVLPNDNGWMTRHFDAIHKFETDVYLDHERYEYHKSEHERALVLMLQGWLAYADAHSRAFESLVGDDGVLGPKWQQIGEAIRGLLNGELGRLDGGTLDGLLLKAMAQNGVDTTNL